MTNEQKRFKIQKIESYEEQISQENKKSTQKTFLFGLAAAAALCTFTVAANANTDNASQLMNVSIGLASTGLGAYHLKGLIESINRKTNLQSKVEDINSELEMPENEESSGMRR